MSFISLNFLLLFALLVIIYYCLPHRIRWILLLLFSLFFYSFAGLEANIFIICSSFFSWACGRLISKGFSAEKLALSSLPEGSSLEDRKALKSAFQYKRKLVLLIGLALNLVLLASLKYTNFFIDNINSLFGSKLERLNLLFPLGISFYTFRNISYLVDVYWEKTDSERNYFKLLLFTSYFPLIIQGPIARWAELKNEFFYEKSFSSLRLRSGLYRMLWGYFKKLVIADRLLPVVTGLCAPGEEYEGIFVLIAALFYAAQLYADFTGGIDITIGMSECLGIKLPENFKRPYFSKNIAEYWRRWHISMGTWFRDYVFYPLSLSPFLMKLSRASRTLSPAISRKLSVYISTLVTWFLTGLWHGPAWNFVVWGLLNAFFILLAEEIRPLSERFRKRFPSLIASRLYAGFEITRTFLLMCAIRCFDCYRNVPVTFSMLKSLFTPNQTGKPIVQTLLSFGLSSADYILILVGISFLIFVSLFESKHGDIRLSLEKLRPLYRDLIYLSLIAAVLVFGIYGFGYEQTEFIYNQF